MLEMTEQLARQFHLPRLDGTIAALLVLTVLATETRSVRAADSPTTASPPDSFSTVSAEWTTQRDRCLDEVDKAQTETERDQAWKLFPDLLVYSRRMLSIAESKPNDAGARDALLWIIDQPGAVPVYHGPLADLQQRAVQILLDHHADDPKVARSAANLNIVLSPTLDAIMNGLVERGRNRETQGLARFALARYLLKKGDIAKAQQARGVNKVGGSVNGDTYRAAYIRSLGLCDVSAMRRTTENLLEEVVAQYGDVQLFDENALGVIPRRTKTLGQMAESLLDEMRHLAIGQPSPDIDGVDLNGKPLKLSNHRGKVVVLVFWASWCGPCLAEIPHERELVERLKGRPFALLGVNGDEDTEAAQNVIKKEQISWPNWNDPRTRDGTGPIAERFHIHGWPSTFVFDAEGIIRVKNARGENLAKHVDALLNELEVRK
jgi:peroxiredoxin